MDSKIQQKRNCKNISLEKRYFRVRMQVSIQSKLVILPALKYSLVYRDHITFSFIVLKKMV
jgi:hypothetical protein